MTLWAKKETRTEMTSMGCWLRYSLTQSLLQYYVGEIVASSGGIYVVQVDSKLFFLLQFELMGAGGQEGGKRTTHSNALLLLSDPPSSPCNIGINACASTRSSWSNSTT